MKSLWYMYVVECADGSFYAGITTDIKRRILEHNYGSKSAKYTRSRRPVRLLYSEEHDSRSSASIAEAKFKRLKRTKKKEYILSRSQPENFKP